jgi:hypothetical protein
VDQAAAGCSRPAARGRALTALDVFYSELQPGAPPLGRHPRPPRALTWVAGGRQLIKYVQHRLSDKLALFDHHGVPLLGELTA